MRVLGGRIPRMVFTEMIEDLFSDQDLIVSPRANRYWSEPVFLDRVRDGDDRLVGDTSGGYANLRQVAYRSMMLY
jgi:hypothetical protein